MNNFSLYGTDLLGDVVKPKSSGPVAERFLFSPFSVLDARSGDWQERKRAWLSLGIAGEVGRSVSGKNSTTGSNSCMFGKDDEELGGGVTSVFDPTLCEIAYKWFSPPGGQVVDPFAGGSVRGIVAGCMGKQYWGCDLSQEQITANYQQASDIAPKIMPIWVCGDSMETLSDAPQADFIYSCPPYGDLERYSDDSRDLSNMEYHAFVAAYKRIILRSISCLKPNRFACFVVGNYRDGKGFYRDLVSETNSAFEQCGARLYNDAVLVTAVGSAALRVTRQFEAGRKLVKMHQNVLVFCKAILAKQRRRVRHDAD